MEPKEKVAVLEFINFVRVAASIHTTSGSAARGKQGDGGVGLYLLEWKKSPIRGFLPNREKYSPPPSI